MNDSSGSQINKGISVWDPPLAHPPEQSERHYVGVHVPRVRSAFARLPNWKAYYTLKALRQYDYNGAFNHRLTAWRWIITRSEGKPLPPDTEEARREAANCIRNLRSCGVTEEIILDRRGAQPDQVHYLFEYDRHLTMPADEARERARGIAVKIAEAAAEAQGARLVTANYVDDEAEMRDGTETRQMPTGRLLPETDKVMYLEVVCDSEYWGDLFFAQPGIADTIFDYEFAVCRGFHVDERCAYDGT